MKNAFFLFILATAGQLCAATVLQVYKSGGGTEAHAVGEVDSIAFENATNMQIFKAGEKTVLPIADVDSMRFEAGVSGVPNVIFDTDMGPDVDDAGALVTLHSLEARGEATIIAVGSSNNIPNSIGACDIFNTYWGKPDIPLGAYKGSVSVHGRRTNYVEYLVREYESDVKTNKQVPEAVETYRKVLASMPDNSVTFISVGFMGNMANLLKSGPDEYSPLNGKELVKKKVVQWVAMAGKYPNGGGTYNMKHGGSAKYSSYAIPNWPTRIVFSGWSIGDAVRTGAELKALPKSNPVRRAFELYANLKDRPSWDQTAVLYAVRGKDPHWRLVGPGTNHVASDGKNSFKENSGGLHYYLRFATSADAVAKEIEGLMMEMPK